ncbi:MAG: SBBP repeat-containing protein [bacterium]
MSKLRASIKLTRSILFSLLLIALTLVPLINTTNKPVHAATTLPAYRYTKTFDTVDGYAYSTANATDTNGNVYVAGDFSGHVIFDGVGGTDSVTSSNQNIFLTKFSSTGVYLGTKTFDTSTENSYGYVSTINVDSQDNVFLSGIFSGTVGFDGVGGTHTITTTDNTAFVTKFNSSGNYGWTKVNSNPGSYSYASSVVSDKNGAIYVAGYFAGTVTFDGVGGTHTVTTASGTSDSYLTKYNSDGTYAWTQTIESATSSDSNYANNIAVDSNNNIYTVGYFYGNVIFDGPGGVNTKNSPNGLSYLNKYSSSGQYQWTRTTSSTSSGYTSASSVAIDPNNNIYVTGDYYGTTIEFNGTDNPQSTSNSSVYLTKYSNDGTYLSTRVFDTSSGSSYAYSARLAIDYLGDVFLLSGYIGTVVFDGPGGSDSQASSATGSSGSTGAITKINSDGSYGWTQSFYDMDENSINTLGMGVQGGISLDNNGNINVSSFFAGSVAFDGKNGTHIYTTNNESAYFTSFSAFPPLPKVINANNTGPAAPKTGFASSGMSYSGLLLIAAASSSILGLGLLTRRINR